jgi:hypothetical protein
MIRIPLRRLGTGPEVATVVSGTLPSVLGITASVVSAVGGFYFLIESKIKETKKETDIRLHHVEEKLDAIRMSVARIEEKLK